MRLLLLLVILLSTPVHAGLFVSSISLAPAVGGVSYYPTIKWFSTSQMPPSGDLYAQGFRWFGPGTNLHSYNNGSPYPASNWFLMIQGASVPIYSGDTWSAVTHRFVTTYGAIGSITDYTNSVKSSYKYDGCFAASKFNAAITTGGGTLFYPGSCGSIDFTLNECRINSVGLIDHGAMIVTEVNGHEARTYANIDCNSPALIRLRVINSNLALGLGISSDLYIEGMSTNGAPVTYAINVPRSFEIKSRLSAAAPQAGNFSGSSYVVVDIL